MLSYYLDKFITTTVERLETFLKINTLLFLQAATTSINLLPFRIWIKNNRDYPNAKIYLVGEEIELQL